MSRFRESSQPAPVRVGVSACLLGTPVRFDGGHKKSFWVESILSQVVTFVPVCPEVEIGLGTPRESLRLISSPQGPRLFASRSGRDHTDAMREHARRRAESLVASGIRGFILKKDSPSCGLHRVRVYDENGVPSRDGRGIFAEELVALAPDLPIEEEGRLNDPVLRESFFERVFAFHRLRTLLERRPSFGDIVAFHSREKILLLAHDPRRAKELGRFLAGAASLSNRELESEYSERFLAILATPASKRRHVNALEHLAGYLKKRLDRESRAEIAERIRDFAAGLAPLAVPLTLIGHYGRRFGIDYLAAQTYLAPHPKELLPYTHI